MIGLSFNAELMDNHVTANRQGNGLFISPITPSSILPLLPLSLSLVLTKQTSQHTEQVLNVHGQKFAVVG